MDGEDSFLPSRNSEEGKAVLDSDESVQGNKRKVGELRLLKYKYRGVDNEGGFPRALCNFCEEEQSQHYCTRPSADGLFLYSASQI